jgi:hypothetical protein
MFYNFILFPHAYLLFINYNKNTPIPPGRTRPSSVRLPRPISSRPTPRVTPTPPTPRDVQQHTWRPRSRSPARPNTQTPVTGAGGSPFVLPPANPNHRSPLWFLYATRDQFVASLQGRSISEITETLGELAAVAEQVKVLMHSARAVR